MIGRGEKESVEARISRTEIGRFFEEIAIRFLERRGYRIIARNWRCHRTEIDIVAWDQGTLVFVEVRGRRVGSWGDPSESVTRVKRRKLMHGAQRFLAAHSLDDVPVRFDVVAIRARGGSAWVEIIADAFSC